MIIPVAKHNVSFEQFMHMVMASIHTSPLDAFHSLFCTPPKVLQDHIDPLAKTPRALLIVCEQTDAKNICSCLTWRHGTFQTSVWIVYCTQTEDEKPAYAFRRAQDFPQWIVEREPKQPPFSMADEVKKHGLEITFTDTDVDLVYNHCKYTIPWP